MDFKKCNCNCNPQPYVVNVEQAAYQNQYFRKEFWTGDCLQMTLMAIPVRGEIGLEIHEENDQYIRIESGRAMVVFGDCPHNMDTRYEICSGYGIFVPMGTWHNIYNMGNRPLKVSSVYAPPHHPVGTKQITKAEAENEDC